MQDHNEVATTANAEVAAAFTAYGAAAAGSRVIGELLKFSKGEYLAGKDGRELEVGARLVAAMDTLAVGWQCWRGGAVAASEVGLVANGFKPPRRNELGDLDAAQWEADNDGQPRDPWQFSNQLLMVDPASGAVFTFVTSSRGGLNAVGSLAKAYGVNHGARFPLIELGVGSYQHRDRSFGRIKFPIFDVLSWVDKEKTLKAIEQAGLGGDEAGGEADVDDGAEEADSTPAPRKRGKLPDYNDPSYRGRREKEIKRRAQLPRPRR
jgi:hypothetical protein